MDRVDVNELTSSSWGLGTPWALQKEVETPQLGLGSSMGDALHHGGDSGTCCFLPPPSQPHSAFGCLSKVSLCQLQKLKKSFLLNLLGAALQISDGGF